MATKRRRAGAIATIAIPAAALTASATLISGAHAQAPALAGADLHILSPDATQSITSDSFALDVSFKSRTKSPVTTAELWVDGVRWVRRDLDTPQTRNVLSFDVDASTLPEGLHTFTIKTISLDGAVSQTELKSQVVRRSPLQDAIAETGSGFGPEMAFKGQLSKGRVAGSIEIAVDAQPKAGVNPYVTFYVDKQFKTLKNYPPYNYVWDTTSVPNGFHEIEATGYLDNSNATTTRKIRVFVDNAGGNTVAQKEIPDLGAKTKTAKDAATLTLTPRKAAVKKAVTKTAPVASAVTKTAPAVETVKTVETAYAAPATKTVTKTAVAATPVVAATPAVARPVTPRVAKPARPTAATVTTPSTAAKATPSTPAVRKSVAPTPAPVASAVTPATVTPAKVTPVATATAAAPATNIVPVVKSLPVTITSSTDGSVEMPLIPERVTPRPTASRFISPKPQHAAQIASPLVVNRAKFSARAPRPIGALVPLAKPVHTSAKATPRAVVRPQALSVLDMMHMQGLEGKTFQVAFNGTRIAFDVQPRVEAGLPIAPFRQIFEHTGGQVMWVKGTQIVRAVNADREIVIKVGQNKATVNGQTLKMERPAFLQQGRTIVPLGFVGRALDVNVKYDPATGHLEITSKK